MARVGSQDGALVEADDVTVVEGAAPGLEVAARVELEGVLGTLDVGDLDALAVAKGAAAPGLAEDLLGVRPRGQDGHRLAGAGRAVAVLARGGRRGDGCVRGGRVRGEGLYGRVAAVLRLLVTHCSAV